MSLGGAVRHRHWSRTAVLSSTDLGRDRADSPRAGERLRIGDSRQLDISRPIPAIAASVAIGKMAVAGMPAVAGVAARRGDQAAAAVAPHAS
jgi:hypothetical protein